MAETKIEWSDYVWNPVRGCTKVSAGCKHCYAETFAERFRGVNGHPYERGFDVRLVPEALDLPLRWKKPRRVFVNSMSDLFHEEVPFRFVKQVWDVIAKARQHIFQILTKRPERLLAFHRWLAGSDDVSVTEWPRNAWLGVSCEDQATTDERIPHLLATPAAVRFVSAEPLLGPVDLRRWLPEHAGGRCSHEHCTPREIDWVIIGGESGPKARPCDLAWIRSLVEQCRAADVPAFVKQLGAKPWTCLGHDRAAAMGPGAPVRCNGEGTYCPQLSLHDRKGGDPSEWPADLRVREMPEIQP